MNTRELITPEMYKELLEQEGHIQLCKGDESDLVMKVLEPKIISGSILGTILDYRAEEWIVVFTKGFYDSHSSDSAALNPLLRKAVEKIRADLTFGKTIGEDDKKPIMLPGLDRPVGEFASDLADYYVERQTLFYRPETSEVVRIGMVKVDDVGHMILGLQSVNENAFVTYLEQDINLYTIDGRGERHMRSIPAQTAKLVLASVDQFRMKLPIVKRLLPVPIPRLVEDKLAFPQKGYDPLFMSFVDEDAPAIKEMPLGDAKELLTNKVYGEFALKSAQDKINAIAHLITPFCRGLFSRETIRSPLFIYLANREGSGKDYAAGIVSIVYQGEAAEDPPVTKTANVSDEEFRKKVIASFKIGRTLLHSSNNKGFLNSAELEALITKERYIDRQLGTNTLLDFPNTLTISLSANVGLTYPADLQRRSIFINLFLDVEDPNARIFDNPDLHGWVKTHRAEVLSALYAIVRNWVEKGMPKSKHPFASFSEWQSIIGGILEAADIGTPVQNDVLNSIGGDEETNSMRQLYKAAHETWGSDWIPKTKIFSELQNPDSAFFGLFGYLDWEKRPDSAKMRMGRFLSKYAGRIFADIRMDEMKPALHSNRAQYRFGKVDDVVPKQQKFQNNGMENDKDMVALVPLVPYICSESIEDNNTNNNRNKSNLPNLPKLPPLSKNSNTILEGSGSNPPNTPFQNNGMENGALPLEKDKQGTINRIIAAIRKAEELGIPFDPENPDPQLNAILTGLYGDEIQDALHALANGGDIYEVRPNVWRLVHADEVM